MVPVVTLVIILGLVIATCCLSKRFEKWWIFRIAAGARNRYKSNQDDIDRVRDQGTMLIITFQIIIGLRQVHKFRGGSDYPSPFDVLVGLIELITLDLFQVIYRGSG